MLGVEWDGVALPTTTETRGEPVGAGKVISALSLLLFYRIYLLSFFFFFFLCCCYYYALLLLRLQRPWSNIKASSPQTLSEVLFYYYYIMMDRR